MTINKKGPVGPIIIDTREKTPWHFSSAETISKKLDCGDYSIEGLEDKVAIERKKSPSEVFGNCSKTHFWDAMERLAEVERPYFIMEFSESDIAKFPKGPRGLPKKLWKVIKVKPRFIFSCINKIWDMGIEVIYAGDADSAAAIAEEIFGVY